jgi:hypothetical protein
MENKNIKDIIHLYIGCKCETDSGKIGTFSGFDICEKDRSMIMHTVRYFDVDDYDVLNDDEMCDRIKLILRPLEDLTEEECGEYWGLIGGSPHLFDRKHFMEWLIVGSTDDEWEQGMVFGALEAALTTNYLISKGFDVFDLIPAGLAIDKTKLTDHGN